MNIAKIGELVENYYRLQAELKGLEELLSMIERTRLSMTAVMGLVPNGRQGGISVPPHLAKLIIQHNIEILTVQLHQIPNDIRQHTTTTLAAPVTEESE